MFVYFHSKTASGNTFSLYPFLSAKLYSDSSLVTRYSFSLCTYNQGWGQVKRETRLTQIKFSLSLNHPIVISLTICQLEYTFINIYKPCKRQGLNLRFRHLCLACPNFGSRFEINRLSFSEYTQKKTRVARWGGVGVRVKRAWVLVRMCVQKSEKPLIHIHCQLEKWTQSFISAVGLNKWTASREFGTYSLCEQRWSRQACASAQSRQNLRCSLI